MRPLFMTLILILPANAQFLGQPVGTRWSYATAEGRTIALEGLSALPHQRRRSRRRRPDVRGH